MLSAAPTVLPCICVTQGGIKPCVSAHVGDQFTTTNEHLLSKTFGYFYFSINAGSFVSTLLTPYLLVISGPHLAFGLPGLLMCLATAVFWSGRWHYAHIPPQGCNGGVVTVVAVVVGSLVLVVPVVSATVSVSVAIFAVVAIVVAAIAAAAQLGRLLSIYVFIAMFWALYDQTGSAWVQQADRMDRNFLGVEWLSSQIQAVNPILVLLLIPTFNGFPLRGGRRYLGLYALVERWSGVRLGPLRKIGGGLFLTVLAFAVSALAELKISRAQHAEQEELEWVHQNHSSLGAAHLASGKRPSIAWQLLAYTILTCAEVMVSITCLEFSYTQAPRECKSLVMALFLASVSMGNAFDALFNALIRRSDGSSRLSDVTYYLFFTAAMLVTATL